MNKGLPSKWRSINETANAAELMNGVIIPDSMIDLNQNIKDHNTYIIRGWLRKEYCRIK